MSKQVVAIGPILPLSFANAIRAALNDNSYHYLVEQLELLINMKVTGVIVYGSMAKSANPKKVGESDVDILVLVDEDVIGGIFGQVENLEIDLHIQSRDASLKDVVTNFVYSEGKVWYDLRPPGLTDWIRRINLYMIEHENPWTKADELRHRAWAYRLVNKIVRIGTIDPAAASLHEARLVASIPTLYKVSHKKYTTSIGNWWSQILQEDKSLANDIATYFYIRNHPPDGEVLRKLIDKIFGMQPKM